MTAEEFEREYAAGSCQTVEDIRQYYTVRPCDCGDPLCFGWQMVTHARAIEIDANERELER